jgi:CTP synthase (UTP-ammonia lyase)
MKARARIALIGNYQPSVKAHLAIPRALELAADTLALKVEPAWTATSVLRLICAFLQAAAN